MKLSKGNIFLPISIIISGLIIAVTILYVAGGTKSPSIDQKQDLLSLNNLIDDDVLLGDPQAKVTITLFGDYQCPVCKQMFDDLEKDLRNDYINIGLVNMVFRDFPIDSAHPRAREAALAAQCAADQNKYWDYHDALYIRQSNIPRMDFAELAENLGLNKSEFQKCLDSKKYYQEIEDDFQYGVKLGITGTPTTFIGTEKIEGWAPHLYQQVRDIIDKKITPTVKSN